MSVSAVENDDGPIFSGGPFPLEVFDGSFGEYIAKNLLTQVPEKIAHINALTGETMTQNEFLELSWKIASGLKCLGAVAGDLVVISGENSFTNSAAATACIFLNTPFAPIDPKLKPFELTNILFKYQPAFLFCNFSQAEPIYDVLKGLDWFIPIILLDRETSEDVRFTGLSFMLSKDPSPIQPRGVKDPVNDIACVIPSSGSTGLPKGVAISHRSMIAAATKMSLYPFGQQCTFLQTSHLFWISGLYSLIGSYLGQIRVFLPKIEPDLVLAAIEKYKPFATFLSPSELTTILKRPDLDPEALAPLEVIATGGGPLNMFIVEQLKERQLKPPKLVHAYGLTENVGGVTDPAPDDDIMSVGKIAAGNDVRIVDHVTGKILKEGEIGEIRVRSPYQFTCYLGHQEATKAAYDDQRFFRTGDLGYVSDKGLLYVTGRIKNLIKYRNMQISPEEIESLLVKMEGIADVGVDGVPHKEDQYHAVAVVVRAAGSTVTADDIHDHVARNMSDHNHLRGGVFFVDEIPRTVHKKMKRDQLWMLVTKLYHERGEVE